MKTLSLIHDAVWGVPSVILLLGVGIYLSITTLFPQIRYLPDAFRILLKKREDGKEAYTPFRALCTSLGATIGTGNLAGVAGAICLGGPGAVFWMWICGFFGMATKFAEIVLSFHYRSNQNNRPVGGPMYIIENGMGEKWRWLAVFYSCFGLIAAVAIGNAVQVKTVISGCNKVLFCFGLKETRTGNLAMGISLAAILGITMKGGLNRIGKLAERLVPISAIAYILLCCVFLLFQHHALYVAFTTIIKGAFHPRAFTGGLIGSLFRCASIGCARGVFSNEAGMGTASIVHSSSTAEHPIEQGMLGLVEVMIDTLVICTLTALVILCSGIPIPYGNDQGILLTIRAFQNFYGDWVSVIITLLLSIFAFATIIGWGIYGGRCCGFLFGHACWPEFIIVEMTAVIIASVANSASIWMLADTVNGMMIFPNLIAITVLSPKLAQFTKEYKRHKNRIEFPAAI